MRTKYWLIAGFVGAPLGLLAGAVIAADDGLVRGTAMGVVTAALTGGIAASYVAWRDHAWAVWGAKVSRRYQAEVVLHHGQGGFGIRPGAGAALAMAGFVRFGGGRNVEGWLVLTKRRLVFQPRGFLDKKTELPITEIAGARRGDSVAQNTIALIARDQRSVEIRVQNRDEWLDKLATLAGVTVLR